MPGSPSRGFGGVLGGGCFSSRINMMFCCSRRFTRLAKSSSAVLFGADESCRLASSGLLSSARCCGSFFGSCPPASAAPEFGALAGCPSWPRHVPQPTRITRIARQATSHQFFPRADFIPRPSRRKYFPTIPRVLVAEALGAVSFSSLELFSAREEIIGVRAGKVYEGKRKCRLQRMGRGQRIEEPFVPSLGMRLSGVEGWGGV